MFYFSYQIVHSQNFIRHSSGVSILPGKAFMGYVTRPSLKFRVTCNILKQKQSALFAFAISKNYRKRDIWCACSTVAFAYMYATRCVRFVLFVSTKHCRMCCE